MDIVAYLNEKRTLINKTLESILPLADGPRKTVIEAMRYSVFAGGKRIRPILCLAGANAVNDCEESVLKFACAIELIHTYSLIHDDLPGIDNDDLRRGVPTCHKQFGEAAAIMAGDALLTEAFFVMSDTRLYTDVDPARLMKAINTLAAASGLRGMIGGQMADIEAEKMPASLELVQFIHKNKTAALIQASIVSGALLAGASDSLLQTLSEYGSKLGLAFQIRDDILDEVGESSVMGKPAGSDRVKDKATYPRVIGLQKSRKIEHNMIDGAIRALENTGPRCEPFKALAVYLKDRTH